MFDLNLSKIDNERFNMRDIALTNLFAAWYMLSCLKPELPGVDTTLAKIYFTECGLDLTGLKDKEINELATEYHKEILNFYRRCQIQRCENIIDRFGKVGYDTRIPHAMTLPAQCKEFFLEILSLANNRNVNNSITKETQCMDSLLDSLIVNNTCSVDHFVNCGGAKVELNSEYNITPDQFVSYVDVVHNAVMNLYRPLGALDETHEDWGTKFRKVIGYIKTLVFMASRDTAFQREYIWNASNDGLSANLMFGAPILEFGAKDELYKKAYKVFLTAYRNGTSKIRTAIEAAVAPYSSLKLEHAVCLFHNTNAVLDTAKLPQTQNSDTFKFLCCQEFIHCLDQKIRAELLAPVGAEPIVP